MRPAKTQISLGIRPVWSEPSLSAWRKLGFLATLWAHSEGSGQTGRMPRLIWVFAGRTLILLVLSCRGSHANKEQGKPQHETPRNYCHEKKTCLKPACSATETSYSLEMMDLASIHIILSRQRTTKMKIRLRGCAGWSASLLFAYGINRFSHDAALINATKPHRIRITSDPPP